MDQTFKIGERSKAISSIKLISSLTKTSATPESKSGISEKYEDEPTITDLMTAIVTSAILEKTVPEDDSKPGAGIIVGMAALSFLIFSCLIFILCKVIVFFRKMIEEAEKADK
eukprot:412185_1